MGRHVAALPVSHQPTVARDSLPGHTSPVNAVRLPRPWRLDRAAYRQLGEAGRFQGKRVQLIDGVVIEMSPMGSPHAEMIISLTRLLIRQAPEELRVRVQLPLAIGADSEPEPDLAVVRATPRGSEHPSTALLVIEVADSSLALDLGAKAELYARAKVPEYWVIDLKKSEVVVHRTPRAARYTSARRVGQQHVLRSVAVPGVTLQLAAQLQD
jgi:Uma2 family endonuclease